MDLTSNIILVTGGGSGIGLELTRQLAALGNTVITRGGDAGKLAKAMLIAEEPDIDPATAKLDPGQPHQAYFNAAVAAVSDVTLRRASDWMRLGKPYQRPDIMAKSTGPQDYGIDVLLPGFSMPPCARNRGAARPWRAIPPMQHLRCGVCGRSAS